MIRVLSTFTVLFVTLFSMGMMAHTALAEEGLDKTDKRQILQRARIAEGVKNGKLEGAEIKKVRRGQRRIRRAERRGVSDEKLNRMQNRQSRKIRRMKNN